MANRLAQSSSLYLRKHAENPIDWWFWCPEALDTAKGQNKPIFLSIGYSSCHWCTVMEGEAFSDQAIADYLNNHYLPIKVDREERPDLDSIYMQGLQMLIGQGGWPLNVFLTPDRLIPFYGGTYFPVQPRYGRRGFLEILQGVHRFYHQEKEKLEKFEEEIAGTLHQSTVLPLDDSEGNLTLNQLLTGIQANLEILRGLHVGHPCFPMIPDANLVLQGSQLSRPLGDEVIEAASQRGIDLALGGIYDQVGGGFHRYTVDDTWTVPHFEKMLYDNGQIVEYLANLWSSGIHEPAFKRAITGTIQWLQREMTAPEGYFYAAQDADNFTTPDQPEPEEGDFYVWSYDQLQTLLTEEELALLESNFTISPQGNFEGKNVLQRTQQGELPNPVEEALEKLFNVRYGQSLEELSTFSPARNNQEAKTGNWQGRIPPVTDTKMIVAWNSLMISGLARTYGIFRQASVLELATRATDFILDQQWIKGRFHRLNYDGEVKVLAQSEDYALFIKALLDLQAVVPEHSQWLEKAIAVQQEFDQFLWSAEQGGYYNAATDASDDLLLRERSYLDNATPSANGIAIANLIRLSLLTENQDYFYRAEQGLKVFSLVMNKSPQACPSLFTALNWYLHPTLVRTSSDQLTSLSNQYFPTCVYQLKKDLPSGAVGLVCQRTSCLEPALTIEELLEQIQQRQTLEI